MPTSRERVLTALSFAEADRVPLDLGGINNTTMHVSIEQRLLRHLGLEARESEIRAINQQVVVPDERLLLHFGCDTRTIFIAEQPWRYDAGTGVYTDQWGIGYTRNPDGNYYNFHRHPLADADDVAAIERYRFPDPCWEGGLDGLEARIASYRGEYCLILEGLREPMFGLPSWLRGTANFYMDLAADDGLADALLDRLLEHYLRWTEWLLSRIGGQIDIVKLADDLGSQESLLISPAMYRRHIKPRQAILYRHIKERCGCKLLLHACGAIRPIIPDLIEIGVDALNPVQISARGMDPAELKREFGGKITFWGGGVDTQHILSTGSPEEVRREVKQNLATFKPGGGYVFAQVHNIMPEVPIANLLAMYEAYREGAGY